jgi:hypothetical protein
MQGALLLMAAERHDCSPPILVASMLPFFSISLGTQLLDPPSPLAMGLLLYLKGIPQWPKLADKGWHEGMVLAPLPPFFMGFLCFSCFPSLLLSALYLAKSVNQCTSLHLRLSKPDPSFTKGMYNARCLGRVLSKLNRF